MLYIGLEIRVHSCQSSLIVNRARSPGQPQIKASYFAGNIQALSVLGPREADARAHLESVLRGLESLSRLDWVPLSWDIEVTRVAEAMGGLAAVRALNKRAMLLSLEGPLIRPIVAGGVGLFGPTPRTFVRMLSHAWSAATRELGSITVANLNDDGGRVDFVGLPPAALSDAIWLEGFCGVIEGIYETTRHRGSATSPRVVDGVASYDCEWVRQRREPEAT